MIAGRDSAGPRGSAALVFVVLLLVTACGRSEAPRGVVLITLDTTRADRLGCYGYADAQTPRLDAIATEGVRFDQAVASVPTTLASHATMFTGHYPPVHGVRYNGMFRLGEASVTIAASLGRAGWATGAVPSAYPVKSSFGLERGFQVYKDRWQEAGAGDLNPGSSRPAEEVTRLGLDWLREVGDKRFFLWLHYYDPHAPYTPPFPYSARFRDRPYDGEIAYMDEQVGRLEDGMRAAGLWDRTLVVVAGDHGEGLYDHGERMHQNLVYESTLRVPLLVRGPGVRRGAVVPEPVSLADLAPTILEAAGLGDALGPVDGVSLLPSLRGATPPRRALYFETLAGSLVYGWSPLEGLRLGKWKYIRSSEPELYDLKADPAEMNNILRIDADIAGDLGARLDEANARWSETAQDATTAAPMDPESLAQLASLGYVGGEVSTSAREGPPPAKLVFLEGDLFQLRDLMLDEDYARALVSADIVLRADPTNRYALHQAARAHAALGDRSRAERFARDLLARYPEFAAGWNTLGSTFVGAKDYSGAEAIFREGLTHAPDDSALAYSLGLSLIAQDRVADAIPVLEPPSRKNGADPSFLVAVALCRARLGEPEKALIILREAIAKGYHDREVLEEEPMLAPLRSVPGVAGVIKGLEPAS